MGTCRLLAEQMCDVARYPVHCAAPFFQTAGQQGVRLQQDTISIERDEHVPDTAIERFPTFKQRFGRPD